MGVCCVSCKQRSDTDCLAKSFIMPSLNTIEHKEDEPIANLQVENQKTEVMEVPEIPDLTSFLNKIKTIQSSFKLVNVT